MIDINLILKANDLVSLAERAGAVFKKGRSHCPIHGGNDETAFAVYVGDDGRQMWQCFSGSCGGGDVISFVMKWQNKDFKSACQFLDGKTIFDPVEMERLAKERHELAIKEREAAQAKEDARRKELQQEQKHLYYHEHMTDFFVNEWIKRGIDESWQGFFCLGACQDFIINEGWHTPTLTIPIYSTNYELLNIKHRLLNPQNPKDKYRPERSGMGAFPSLFAFPELGFDGSITWVIEGEIKALVSATINPEESWQFIGVPGRSNYKGIIDKLKGKNIVVVPDPGAEKDAATFCKSVNGRWLPLPDKIDDMIVANGYDGAWLKAIEKQARRIK